MFVRVCSEQKEKIEQRAREDADKLRKEREAVAQQKEEERLARKKVVLMLAIFFCVFYYLRFYIAFRFQTVQRLEMIMRRTRGGDSPTPTSGTASNMSSPGNPAASGDNSPASLTPSGGHSPYNSSPDRMASPVNTQIDAIAKDDSTEARCGCFLCLMRSLLPRL